METSTAINLSTSFAQRPFGMLMVGRSFESGSGYRYGFNGKENDDEIAGNNNYLDFGARVYDVRLGRFLNLDPFQKEYPHLAPYQFADNTPIQAIDVDGLKKYHYLRTLDDQGNTKLTLIYVETVYKKVVNYYINAPNSLNGRYPVYKMVEDTEDQFIVHQEGKWYKQFKMTSTTVIYDESVTYKTYEEAKNSTNEDFDWTSQDASMAWAQAASKVREESMTQGGLGAMVYASSGSIGATEEIVAVGITGQKFTQQAKFDLFELV